MHGSLSLYLSLFLFLRLALLAIVAARLTTTCIASLMVHNDCDQTPDLRTYFERLIM